MIQFPPDVTAIYQFVLFLGLWFALKKVVFDRFLESLEARSRRTDGAIAEAGKLREEAEAMRLAHEEFISGIRREAVQAKEEIQRAGAREERELLDNARNEAAHVLAELRERAEVERESARRSLEQETQGLAEQIASSFLGRGS